MWDAVASVTLGVVAVVAVTAAVTKPHWWGLGHRAWWGLHLGGVLLAAVTAFTPVSPGLLCFPVLVYAVFVHSVTDVMYRRASEGHMMVAAAATMFCHLTYSMRAGVWEAGYFVIPVVLFFLLFVLCPSADTMMVVLIDTIFMPEILEKNNNYIIFSALMAAAVVVVYVSARLIKAGKTVPVIPVVSVASLLAVPLMI